MNLHETRRTFPCLIDFNLEQRDLTLWGYNLFQTALSSREMDHFMNYIIFFNNLSGRNMGKVLRDLVLEYYFYKFLAP